MCIFDCSLLLICLLMLCGLFCGRNVRFIIPLRAYLIIFIVPILVFFVLNAFDLQNFCAPRLFDTISQYSSAFVVIVICVYIVLFTRFKRNFVDKRKCADNCMPSKIVSAAPTVCVISMVLLIIYVLFSNNANGDSCHHSSSDTFAVCAAIIAACATLYTIQRTLKQELTRNRQAWINEVRLESANMIAIVDKIKFYIGIKAPRDKLMELYPALIDSCMKLRMHINPRDIVAPFITNQLDAIMNSVVGSNNYAEDGNSVNFNEINLRRSFMPWILVLLKVEWERVKAILESREELSDGYYSEEVYRDQWDARAFEEYGIHIGNPIEQLFPGFTFNNDAIGKIQGSIEKLRR